MESRVISVTTGNYREEVFENRGQIVLVFYCTVEFWNNLRSVFDELSNMDGAIKICSINTYLEPELGQMFGMTDGSGLVFLNDGIIVKKDSIPETVQGVRSWFERMIRTQ
ncbi:MAG: hypothetical protein IJS22_05810 [Lachnospiraceae bacterium]|nr:hypothetical protein [Lachnospiraceae bacterium]